jgi:hypothetical protein
MLKCNAPYIIKIMSYFLFRICEELMLCLCVNTLLQGLKPVIPLASEIYADFPV